MRSLVIAAALLLSACSQPECESKIVSDDAYITARVTPEFTQDYIVILHDDEDVDEFVGNLVATDNITNRFVFRSAIKGFSAQMPEEVLLSLQNDDRVKYIERDMVIGIERGGPPPGKGGSDDDTGDACSNTQTVPYGTLRVGGPIDGSGLTAWVLDTGVDLESCDLNIDLERSANFVSRGKDTVQDGHGHGTHVSGTIGALDNNTGTVGVAPNTTIVGVRVLDNRGAGTTSSVLAGIDYVTQNAWPGDVANMSLGGSYSAVLNDAVYNSASTGIIYAIAAGNSARHAGGYSPASTEHPNVYTISATDSNDAFASFSNYGNPPIDFAAPGVEIVSLAVGGGTAIMSGTSMAAPHAAGVLLFGPPATDGLAVDDPDEDPDLIIHF